ncbi:MAG: DUF445 domain-containing protein [Bacteroidota bacterium]|nr:DUF445 domain-containing protein [Bacteroidota bacterium]
MNKKAQLNRFKWFATSLVFLMAVVYVVCEVFFKQQAWAGYVKAFAEAAMVGALADWFAVVALFRHPFGIPIPHTNLIESSKGKIGDNLGSFVTDNFLTAATIKPRLEKLQVAARLGEWLLLEKNRQRITAEIIRIVKEGLLKLNDEEMTRIISAEAVGLVEKIPVHKIVGNGLQKILVDDVHQDWLTTIAANLGDFLEKNRDMVKQKVKDESHFLIPGFVDNMIAEKITNGGIRYMEEIAADIKHPVRKNLSIKLQEIATDMQQGGEWAEKITHLKNELLSPRHLQDYSKMLWQYIKKQIETDLDKKDSGISGYIENALKEAGISLQKDPIRQQRIDHFIQIQAFRLIMKYKHSAGELISQTVSNWPSKQLSEKLELEVGKDLQFIRINGTLVGGAVGLLIYILTKWL